MPRPRHQILVCTNQRPPESGKPSCQPSGGLDLYQRLKDLVRARGLKDEVLLTRTGCLRHCSRGPVVAAWPANVWFAHAHAEDAEALLAAVLDGQQAEGLEMPDVPWE